MTTTTLEHALREPALRTRRAYPWLALLLCVTAFVIPAGIFAAKQTLWLDETTQLSGLKLGPVEVTLWLAGTPHDFGFSTAPDRMPPLSYWLGQLWAWAFGPGELAQRWFGIACVALAVAVIFETARRAFGTASGVVAALLVGLSSSIIERSVEIRAYPLYLLLAACGYCCAARWLVDQRRLWLWGTVAAVVLTMYAHFYGVVFAVMLLTGLAAARWRCGATLRPLLWPTLALAVAGLGLIPFVTASVDVSRYGAHWALADKLLALGDLLWSFFGHRLLAHVRYGPELASVAFLFLTVTAWRAWPRMPLLGWTLLLSLSLGLLTAASATFVLTVFKPALFQYNLWMVPALALLLSAGVGSAQSGPRRWALAGAILMLSVHGLAAYRLALDGQNVVHGPDPALAQCLEKLGPREVTLLHDGGSGGAWVQIYYPLAYRLHGLVRQYQYDEEKGDFYGLDDARVRLTATTAPTRYLVVVRSGGRTWGDLTKDRATPFPDGPATKALRASPQWRQKDGWVYAAGMKMNIDVFERVPTQP